eukprot:CAMPEP_0114631188 /NCGR_PEP_ID=MMETSP0168-20121206/14277_1 /TAXON_ID=95228 ORGANISM="Vannella sp., Strain DIVA3 517/6/12" /NCGR_SAMPLE_ID=MMETSP0168 /ASSEMBLY_ACC=CAM_ASM_000044 /LENGTH=262 /DNA_ID=CAMNT_0001842733 /DNA_START=112 /DNA_END=897 /DNA_ORIENTATION=+
MKLFERAGMRLKEATSDEALLVAEHRLAFYLLKDSARAPGKAECDRTVLTKLNQVYEHASHLRIPMECVVIVVCSFNDECVMEPWQRLTDNVNGPILAGPIYLVREEAFVVISEERSRAAATNFFMLLAARCSGRLGGAFVLVRCRLAAVACCCPSGGRLNRCMVVILVTCLLLATIFGVAVVVRVGMVVSTQHESSEADSQATASNETTTAIAYFEEYASIPSVPLAAKLGQHPNTTLAVLIKKKANHTLRKHTAHTSPSA